LRFDGTKPDKITRMPVASIKSLLTKLNVPETTLKEKKEWAGHWLELEFVSSETFEI
jgi:hypothetical protein